MKSFHKNLQRKIKIIWRLHPIRNEITYMVNGQFKIVVKFELYESKDKMQEKEYMEEYGALTASFYV